MTVLGSGEVCWEKQACPEFISPKSDGGGAGLRKHVGNSILGEKKEKERILHAAKAASLEVACGNGASLKHRKAAGTIS